LPRVLEILGPALVADAHLDIVSTQGKTKSNSGAKMVTVVTCYTMILLIFAIELEWLAQGVPLRWSNSS
jgi:hypothetical protein